MVEIITRSYKEIEVIFSDDSNELYINATKIAKKFKKDVREWRRSKQTTEYIDALSDVGFSHTTLIKSITGNFSDKREQGTWIHKKLIIAFARWLSPKFAVWCDQQIEEILTTGSYSTKPKEDIDLDSIKKRAELIISSKDQFIAFEEIFYKIGITRKEELAITSNRAVAKETGVDFIELAELKGVSTPDRYFTVTELCQKVMNSDDFSEDFKKLVSTKKGDKPRPQNLNKLLETNGFQTKVDGIWKPTEKAKDLADFVQNKSNYSEKTVFHTVWKTEVLEELF